MNWRYRRLPLLSIILLPFFLVACNDSPPGPPPPPNGPDTTSHNFIFEIDTLGDASSLLYDTAIISENNIWAVGDFYLRDSTGQVDPLRYNVAQWDGSQWEVKRITVMFRGNPVTPPLEGISTFSATDIWLVGSLPIHGDGQTWTIFDLRAMPGFETVSVSKAWGTSPSDMYFVGANGSIVHYNGATWQAMQSGTTLPLLDVFGRSATEVYAVGGDRSTAVVLKYDGTRWATLMNSYYFGNGFDSTELFRTQLYGHLNGAWVDESGTLYVVGEYVYQMKAGQWGFTPGIADNYLNAPIFSRGFLTSIRGEAGNDFVTAGERLTVIHHNGSSGIQVGPQFSFASPIDFYGVDMKGPFIVGVGTSGGRAIAVRLHR